MKRSYRAPGRVNLIGEHTDYNQGFVLPIALDLATVAQVEPPTHAGQLSISSRERAERFSWTLDELSSSPPRRNWTDYCIGVAQELSTRGIVIAPQQISISSAVPEGAGLSSSAALEVSVALALLGDRPFDRLELAKLCQSAERNFVGTPSGIMDQYISIFGSPGAALKIDCRSLTHEVVAIPADVSIIAVNSMVKHELGQSAYRERVSECLTAARALGVSSLRDASLHQLEMQSMPAVPMRRARHIITENLRVELFVAAAERGDLDRMGQLFFESHVSMQHDYEITCAEVDFLVQAAEGIDGVYGARMTGGGFGGCTVNLVRPDAVEVFRERIRMLYRDRYDVIPDIFECLPSAGAGPEIS